MTPVVSEAELVRQMIREKIDDSVERGIEFLRSTYGEEWVEKIDTRSLQLESGFNCVLGQVHPHYHPLDVDDEGYSAALRNFNPMERHEFSEQHGFSIPDPLVKIDGTDHYCSANLWEVLNEAWQDVIPREKTRFERLKAVQEG